MIIIVSLVGQDTTNQSVVPNKVYTILLSTYYYSNEWRDNTLYSLSPGSFYGCRWFLAYHFRRVTASYWGLEPSEGPMPGNI